MSDAFMVDLCFYGCNYVCIHEYMYCVMCMYVFMCVGMHAFVYLYSCIYMSEMYYVLMSECMHACILRT